MSALELLPSLVSLLASSCSKRLDFEFSLVHYGNGLVEVVKGEDV